MKVKKKHQKKVNHRPQLEKVKNKVKKMSKNVEKKSKLWLLALADYWSQEKSTVDHSSKKSKKKSKKMSKKVENMSKKVGSGQIVI